MKKLVYFLMIFMALIAYSCAKDEFEQEPGDRVTSRQLVGMSDPSPFVNAMYAYMIKYNGLNLASTRHNDFGYMNTVLASELWGQDMVQYGSKYGWFYSDYKYSNRGYDQTDMMIHWTFFYKLIKTTNDVLTIAPSTVTDDVLKNARGQALAMRAFAYLNLVELYQFTYKGNESKPAVPIVTEKMAGEELANNPRRSVQEVYDLIMKDLTEAYSLLTAERPSKVYINKNVVAGFLARAYLNMENWGEAAKYAAEAQTGFPVMNSTWLNEGFVSISNPSWMWASDVNDQSDIAASGIVNYTSHISTTAYGYASAGAMYKNISSDLYSKIPANDKRMKWWLPKDSTMFSPIWGAKMKYPKYANMKYGYYNENGDNFNDLCYMRVEEMKLIEAEALGFTNFAQGKAKLEEFVKTRQTDFASNATNAQQLQEEVWLQRRIELWGEGFAFNDLKRLKKGTVRNYAGSNHKSDALKDLPATSDFFNLLIPRNEILNNKGIPESANNPIPQ